MEPTKICNKCNKEKPLDNFHNDKRSKDGKRYCCKECRKNDGKNYYINKRKSKEYKKKYYKENKESISKRVSKYTELNIDKIKKYKKNWRIKNKERLSIKNKDYYEQNKDSIHIREYKRYYYRKNPHIIAWRSLLNRFVKNFNTIKYQKTHDMLGYSAEELKNHISNLFTVGMSWENHGEWHIDHIKPLYTFEKDAKASEVNALSNLRPLWSTTR